MRPVDRAAVSFLDGLRVGQRSTTCRECGGEIRADEDVYAVARRPRSDGRGRWQARLYCAGCAAHATPGGVTGVDEFAVCADMVSTPITASAAPAVTLASVRVRERSLAYGDEKTTKAHSKAEGL